MCCSMLQDCIQSKNEQIKQEVQDHIEAIIGNTQAHVRYEFVDPNGKLHPRVTRRTPLITWLVSFVAFFSSWNRIQYFTFFHVIHTYEFELFFNKKYGSGISLFQGMKCWQCFEIISVLILCFILRFVLSYLDHFGFKKDCGTRNAIYEVNWIAKGCSSS